MTGRAAPRAEAGFTLLELIVAIALLGIIMLPLAAAFAVGVRASQSGQESLLGSSASLFTSAYWAGDVQSADTILVGGATCSGESLANVVTFTWRAADGGAGSSVSYAVRDASGGGYRLVRVACGASTAVNTIVPRLRFRPDVSPMVSCEPASCTLPEYQTDGTIQVKMTLTTEKPAAVTSANSPSVVTFSVSGTRRSTERSAA